VRIVVLVARVTASYEVDVKNRFDVAFGAGNFSMAAEKFVVCMNIVIKERFDPLCTAMASVAPIAAVPVMRVIFEMARGTSHVHLVLKRVLRVAIAALQCGMFAFKREFGIADMIKTGVVPVRRVVAALAFLATPSFVRVVRCVASEAGGRRIQEGPVFMTVQAGSLPMFPD